MGKWVFMGCGPPQESLENTRINTMGTLSQGYTQVSLEKRFRGWWSNLHHQTHPDTQGYQHRSDQSLRDAIAGVNG